LSDPFFLGEKRSANWSKANKKSSQLVVGRRKLLPQSSFPVAASYLATKEEPIGGIRKINLYSKAVPLLTATYVKFST
jgi:hypothetical protein